MNDQVVTGLLHDEVGGGSPLEHKGVDGGGSRVRNGVVTVAFIKDIGIVAAATREFIVAGAAVEGVIAVIAIKGVVAGTSVENVIAIIAAQAVVAGITIEGIGVIPAAEGVIAVGTIDGEAHGGEISHGEGLIVKGDTEFTVASGAEVVGQGDGVVGAVGVDNQVIAGFCQDEVRGRGIVKDQGVDRICC